MLTQKSFVPHIPTSRPNVALLARMLIDAALSFKIAIQLAADARNGRRIDGGKASHLFTQRQAD
ncbi:MAG TPA: hypothetical protein VKA18_06335 [Alphaproteobacteria bacterium]|nr:hypothetical protein [Alphaproteobacteria bacterium]